MNSYMTIMVRVVSARAQAQMAALQAQTAGVERATRAAAAAPLIGGPRHMTALTKWGSQLQWAGRQIQYNFTIPLAIAAGLATKFALDNEKAMTRVAKVYGDTSAAAAQFRRENKNLTQEMANNKAASVFKGELDALGEAFEALSNKYGVQQKEVLDVAGSWAAAGASGADLAKSVELTMQAMVLGEMEAGKATESLIAIQSQYNLSAGELTETLAYLNAIENQTGISMSGLIDGFSRAAGAARTAGIGVRELGAMMAALVPATGSAANAGNALKTIFSRLMAPTKEATQVMEAMGLNVTAMSWQSSTAAERLKIMSREFNSLGGAAQASASSVIASAWQINKFSVLMRELGPELGYYEKALAATSSRGKAFTTMQFELNKVLTSNPQRLKQIWVIMQNAMADVIQPMIPYIVWLANEIKNLFERFANMNPVLQKFILLGLAGVAIFGLFAKTIGALGVLIGLTGRFLYAVNLALGIFRVNLILANGAAVLARTGVIGFLASLLRGPIFLFAEAAVAGFALIGLAVRGAGRLLVTAFMTPVKLMVPLVAAAWGEMVLITNAGFALLRGAYSIFIAKWAALTLMHSLSMITTWTLMWTRLGLITTMGTSMLATIFITFGSVLTTIWSGFGLIIGRAMNMIAASMAVWGATLGAAWTGVWSYLKAVYLIFLASMTTITTMWRVGMISLWAALGAALEAVWIATSSALIAVSGAMFRGIYAVFVLGAGWLRTAFAASSGGLIAIWKTAQMTMVILSMSFWSTMTGLWAARAAMLQGIWMVMSTNVVWATKLMYRQVVALMTRMWIVATGPWGIAIAILIGIVWVLRDTIAKIMSNIGDIVSGQGKGISGIFQAMGDSIMSVFNALPQSVQNAMVAVVTVVRDAALAVYDWFSYINPWAHHSPSLVENVTTGMDEVTKQFGKLGKIGGLVKSAYAEIKRFGQLTAQLGISANAAQAAQDRATLKNAGAGQALASYNRLIAILNKLTPILDRLKAKMDAQQAVVDRWQKKVDASNRALDAQTNKLERLQNVLSKYQDQLNAAQDSLATYASAPLEGMQEMNDQIHANEMAQNALKLEMMDMESAYGSLDEIKSKLEAINGAQELLRGEQSALRAAGAGSEILSQYDAEMDKLDEQKDKYQETADQLSEMQARLDALQLQAERLDLVKAMKFDDLQYQIDKAANAMEEMPFDVIMAGIQQAQADILKYGNKVDQATAAVAAQQAVVDQMTAARDRLQARLDKEELTLSRIKDRYDQVNDAINAISDSMADVVAQADKMNEALKGGKKGGKDGYVSPGLQNFLDAGNATFPDPGGTGTPIRKDWSSQIPDIKDITAQLNEDTAKMFGDLNPFKPIIAKVKEGWKWAVNYSKEAWGKIVTFMGGAFSGIKVSNPLDGFVDTLRSIGKFLTKVIKDIAKFVKLAWDLLGPDIIDIFNNLVEGAKIIWEEIGPELGKFAKLWKPAGKAIKNLWTIAKPILGLLAAGTLFFIKIFLGMLSHVIVPVFKAIGKMLAGVIRIIRGVFEVIIGILTGDWKMAWDGFVDIIVGAWNVIWGALKGIFEIIIGLVVGLFEAIVDIAKWCWDVLFGHSIIPDIINAFWKWFKKLTGLGKWFWNHVLEPVVAFARRLLDRVVQGFKTWWDRIKGAWNILKKLGGWVWDNVFVPVVKRVADLWTRVKAGLGNWWDGIKNVWSNLKKLAGWIWDNVLAPIKDKFVKAFTDIKDWFNNNSDIFKKPIAKVVNVAIDAVNLLIKGLNKVADILPGIDWDIDLITRMANGGTVPSRHVRGGFKTNGARAIVGEGKANHPEFVIPTDPTYRHRAMGLLHQAAAKLGVGSSGVRGQGGEEATALRQARGQMSRDGVPMFGIGGILDDIKNAAGSVKDAAAGGVGWMKGNVHRLASAAYDPLESIARGKMNEVGWFAPRDIGKFGLNEFGRWVDGADKVYEDLASGVKTEMAGGPRVEAALKFAKAQRGKPYKWTGVGPDGYDCSGFMSALTNVLRDNPPYSRVGSTGTFPWGGFSSGVGKFTIGSIPNYGGSGIGHMAGTLGKVNVESRGDAGVLVGAGARGYNDPGFSRIAHLAGLASGGIVKARPGGGTAFRLGDGGQDEVVTPLPRGWSASNIGLSGSGKTENHFHGDLIFPNITTGEDAETLIENLKKLAGE